MPTPPSTPKAKPAKITTSEPAETTPTAVSAPIPTPETVAAERTPSATPPPTSEPAVMLTPPITHQESTSDTSLPLTPPATPIATPRKQISWAEIASRPVIAPKPSRLPVLTSKIIPKALETAAIVCPPTPPPTPPQEPVPKHQHQISYLTIDDLFEMFAEKRTKSDLLHTKKTKSSPVSHQSKITSYFRPAANQSKSISQGSKTPNPRSLNQHTPAESSRTKSTPSKWSEKSAILPYKLPTFSHLPSSKISSILPYKLPVISGRLRRALTPRAPFGISASYHACRICSGTFGSNNGLHRHLRAIHFVQAPRRSHGNTRKHGQEHGRNLSGLGDA
ncbi:hypothetical protein G7Y79_00002g008410 [Physcia stellaris]|nr:hypothetical protein G7Y79_00002g008410 [Physcia stellaris]